VGGSFKPQPQTREKSDANTITNEPKTSLPSNSCIYESDTGSLTPGCASHSSIPQSSAHAAILSTTADESYDLAPASQLSTTNDESYNFTPALQSDNLLSSPTSPRVPSQLSTISTGDESYDFTPPAISRVSPVPSRLNDLSVVRPTPLMNPIATTQEDFEDSSRCPICFEQFGTHKTPQVLMFNGRPLSCQNFHPICEGCARSIDGGKCPFCRGRFNSIHERKRFDQLSFYDFKKFCPPTIFGRQRGWRPEALARLVKSSLLPELSNEEFKPIINKILQTIKQPKDLEFLSETALEHGWEELNDRIQLEWAMVNSEPYRAH